LQSRGVQLVFLGACETGRRDEQNAWSGVVTNLMAAGIPAVIAMQYKIWDESAIEFSRTFYKALAAGLPLEQAVSLGRIAVFNQCGALKDEEQRQKYWRDWGVPVLYCRVRGNFVLPTIMTESQRKTLLDELQGGSDVVQNQNNSVNQKVNQTGKYNINIGQTGGLKQEVPNAPVGQTIGLQKGKYITNLQGDHARIGDDYNNPKKTDSE
jgi:hypothetical protein